MALIADKAAHDPIQASWGNTIRNQTIQVTTSAARPSSPTEGFVIWETDTNLLKVYDGSAWTDLADYIGGAWTSWTASDFTLTQSGVVTKNVNYAKSKRTGKKLRWQGHVTVAGPGTAANVVVVSLPTGYTFAYSAAIRPIGTGVIYDISASTFYTGVAVIASSTTFSFLPCSADSSQGLGAAVFTAQLVSTGGGDQVSWDIEAEIS